MKKLLIIMESMRGGGAEKVLLDLLGEIDRTRFDITLLIVFRIGAHLDRLPKDLKTIFLYPGRPHGLRRLVEHFVPGRDWLYRRDARKATEGMSWDVIVSFMEGPALKIHNCIADKAPRNVTWVHINLAVTHWTKYLYTDDRDEANDYRKMDRVVFVSQGALDAFSGKFGVPEDKLEVIHNIIPTEEIRRRSKEFSVDKPGRKMICTVGRIVEQKRHDRLLEAIRILKERGADVELRILGTGDLEEKMKGYAKKLGIDDMVSFLGFQPNPYPYIAASDIFVLSSDTEGYPTVVCEAMVLGKPIVSTHITGSGELLKDGVGVLTALTPEALADGIESVLNSQEMAEELSRKALEASQQFRTDKVLEKVYRAIEG